MDSQQPGPSGLQASRSRVYDTARVIQHLEDSDLDDDFTCDSAYTTSEINFCSLLALEERIDKLDSLNTAILERYDHYISLQKRNNHRWDSLGQPEMIDHEIDYINIKHLYIDSFFKHLEYVALHKQMIGTEIGKGTIRYASENFSMVMLLDHEIERLEDIFEFLH